MPCELCNSIERHKRNAKGHDKLVQVGPPENYKIVGQATIGVTKHKCTICGAMWRHENDKNDDHAGWTVAE